MHHLVVIVAALVVLVRGGLIYAEAQEATPPVDVAGAEACQVDPRSPDFILTLAGAPTANVVPPAASPTPFASPDGKPADAQTVDAITATMQEAIACFNAADLLRAFALFSDDYFRRLIPEGPVGEAFTGFLTGAPAPVTQIGVHAIQDVRVLPDGRVVALVTLVDPETPSPEDADLRSVVFVMVGDRWLIDEVIELEAIGTPAAEESDALEEILTPVPTEEGN